MSGEQERRDRLGGGVVEKRREGNGGEEQDSHYRPGLRCLLLAPASSTGAASRFGAGGREIRRKRGRRISIRGADRTFCAFCARLIRKGRRDRSIPGPPRSVLGLQDPPLPGGGKQLRSSSSVLLLPRRYRAVHGHISAIVNCRTR